MVSLLIRLKYVCSVQVFAKWPTAISRTDNIIRASVSPTVLRCGETGTVVMGLTDRKKVENGKAVGSSQNGGGFHVTVIESIFGVVVCVEERFSVLRG